MKKYRVMILGIGGVGGYYGGLLAKYAIGKEHLEIVFVARGEHKEQIIKGGLKVKTKESAFTAFPSKIVEDPADEGIFDLIIICVKAYDLTSVCNQIRYNVSARTVLLPLQNGIDIPEQLTKLLDKGKVLEGLVYVISNKTGPGEISQYGDFDQIYVGSSKEIHRKASEEVAGLLKAAGIRVAVRDDIIEKKWEKFLFISTLSSVSTYLEATAGEIIENPGHLKLIENQLIEIRGLAVAKGIDLKNNIVEDILEKIKKLDNRTKPSMQLDYENSPHSEIETLIGYVTREARRVNVAVPVTDKLYQALLERKKQAL